MVYSTLYEIVVDFTRDYGAIRNALRHIEHYDKTSVENMLQAVNSILVTNWGMLNYSQVLVFTDCGIGFGATSMRNIIDNYKLYKTNPERLAQKPGLPFQYSNKLSFICLGQQWDSYFQMAVKLYQALLDCSGQNGKLFMPQLDMNPDDDPAGSKLPLNFESIKMLIKQMCEENYRPFEATLKCGGYYKLEGHVHIWPPPMPYVNKESKTSKIISRKLEICGFLSLTDIGSPMSISRHLILPKPEHHSKPPSPDNPTSDHEKLAQEIKTFYTKSSDDDDQIGSMNESNRESVCLLLHGALKVENMAALVLLNDDWFGFIFSYADSKKKSNLMLTVLPPGHNNIPWLGDLRYIGTVDDATSGEALSFPVKPEKRSYSQNCVVWIKQAGLQSDIQKVLRHAKKLPEKTQHFYKELNRIRRAALSLGFIELIDGMAKLFEREVSGLPPNASPDCALQLNHAAMELRRINDRDLKTVIIALPTKYNML